MTDYSELVEALRCCGDVGCHKCPYQKHIHEHFCWTMAMHDAADAIEALQAKLPKRGKWVGVSPMVDTVQCSVCGGQLFSEELETPYCPYCGAKMEVNHDGL